MGLKTGDVVVFEGHQYKIIGWTGSLLHVLKWPCVWPAAMLLIPQQGVRVVAASTESGGVVLD